MPLWMFLSSRSQLYLPFIVFIEITILLKYFYLYSIIWKHYPVIFILSYVLLFILIFLLFPWFMPTHFFSSWRNSSNSKYRFTWTPEFACVGLVDKSKCLDIFHKLQVHSFFHDVIHIACSLVVCIKPWSVDNCIQNVTAIFNLFSSYIHNMVLH